MANLFLANEILEMNIAEERNGAAYYAALSEFANSKKLRLAAAEISQQEKMHERRFIRLLEETEQREAEESFPGEYEAYIESLMRNKMFSDEDGARAEAMRQTDLQAVQFALKTERATLNLLNELKKQVEPREMAVVNLTIEEEEQHVTQLEGLLKELS